MAISKKLRLQSCLNLPGSKLHWLLLKITPILQWLVGTWCKMNSRKAEKTPAVNCTVFHAHPTASIALHASILSPDHLIYSFDIPLWKCLSGKKLLPISFPLKKRCQRQQHHTVPSSQPLQTSRSILGFSSSVGLGRSCISSMYPAMLLPDYSKARGRESFVCGVAEARRKDKPIWASPL